MNGHDAQMRNLISLSSTMKIIVRRDAAQELQFRKLVFHALSVRYYLLISLLILIGLVFVFFIKSQVNGVDLPFWNFGSALGVAFIMSGLLRITDLIRNRSFLLKGASDTTIVIDAEGILYQKPDSHIKYKWEYFKFCRINNRFIILTKEVSVQNALIVSRNEVSSEEFNFIKAQLFIYKVVNK